MTSEVTEVDSASAEETPQDLFDRRMADIEATRRRDWNKINTWGIANVLKQNQGLVQATVASMGLGAGAGEGGDQPMEPEKLAKYLDTLPFGPTNITIYEGGAQQGQAQPQTRTDAGDTPSKPPETVSPPSPVKPPPTVQEPTQTEAQPPSPGETPRPTPEPSHESPGNQQPPSRLGKAGMAALVAGSLLAGGLGTAGLSYLMRPKPEQEAQEFDATLEWEITGGEVTTDITAGGSAAHSSERRGADGGSVVPNGTGGPE